MFSGGLTIIEGLCFLPTDLTIAECRKGICFGEVGNAVKRFDKQKSSKIKTSQIAIQAWKADTSFAGAVRPREEALC